MFNKAKIKPYLKKFDVNESCNEILLVSNNLNAFS